MSAAIGMASPRSAMHYLIRRRRTRRPMAQVCARSVHKISASSAPTDRPPAHLLRSAAAALAALRATRWRKRKCCITLHARFKESDFFELCAAERFTCAPTCARSLWPRLRGSAQRSPAQSQAADGVADKRRATLHSLSLDRNKVGASKQVPSNARQ